MLIKEIKELLYKQFDIVEKALPGKTIQPILNNILWESSGNQVTLVTTNFEIGIRTVYTPRIEIDRGSVLIPGKIIDIMRSLPEKQEVEIHIDRESFKISINCGASRFNLQGSGSEDYPDFPEKISEKDPLKIKENILKDLIRKTIFGVSGDESRPAFTGVLFSIKQDSLTVTASDTYRLIIKEKNIIPWGYGNGEYLIPARALRELQKILGDTDEEVIIFPADNQIVFSFKNIFFSSRLLEEKFPDVSGVIPEKMKIKILVDKTELEAALNRASLLVEGNLQVVKFALKGGILEVSAYSEIGRMEEQIEITEKEGEDLDIYLNIRFISDVLKIIDTQRVVIELLGNESPCIIKPASEDNYMYLVLPIKMS